MGLYSCTYKVDKMGEIIIERRETVKCVFKFQEKNWFLNELYFI